MSDYFTIRILSTIVPSKTRSNNYTIGMNLKYNKDKYKWGIILIEKYKMSTENSLISSHK